MRGHGSSSASYVFEEDADEEEDHDFIVAEESLEELIEIENAATTGSTVSPKGCSTWGGED